MGRPLLSIRLAAEEPPAHPSNCDCEQCRPTRTRSDEERIRPSASLPRQPRTSSTDIVDNFQSANSALEAAFQRLEILRSTLQGLERVRSSDAMNPGHSSLVLSDSSRPEGRSTGRDRSDDWFGRTLTTIMSEDDMSERISELRRRVASSNEERAARDRDDASDFDGVGVRIQFDTGLASRRRTTSERIRHFLEPESDRPESLSPPAQPPATLEARLRRRSLVEAQLMRSLGRGDTRGLDRETSSATSLGRRVASRIERGTQSTESPEDDVALLGSPQRRRRAFRTPGSSSSARSLTRPPPTQPPSYHHTATRSTGASVGASTSSNLGSRLLPPPPRWLPSDDLEEIYRDLRVDESDSRSYRVRRRINADGHEEVTNIAFESLDGESRASTLDAPVDAYDTSRVRESVESTSDTHTSRTAFRVADLQPPPPETLQAIFEMLARRSNSELNTESPAAPAAPPPLEEGPQTPTSTVLQLDESIPYINPLPQRLEDMMFDDTMQPRIIDGIRTPLGQSQMHRIHRNSSIE